MARTNAAQQTGNPRDITRDRYDSAARLLRIISERIERKLVNTRPGLNIRHDWTDVGDAEKLMSDLWDIAQCFYLNEADGDETVARALAMQAAFKIGPKMSVPESECGHCHRYRSECVCP